MKIAVTSTDGANVNQHFGKADSFYIYEITGNTLMAIEKKNVNAYCENIDGVPVNPNHQFELDRFTMVYNVISDCEVLYTKQIGDIPRKKLEELGVSVQLCNCAIESIVSCSGKCD
jgi:predicted Fe-Mo cluster-binding NifX family protein